MTKPKPKKRKPRRVVLGVGALGFSDKEGWYFQRLTGPMSAVRAAGRKVRVVAEVLDD